MLPLVDVVVLFDVLNLKSEIAKCIANLACLISIAADQATKLILELQTIARDAGHRHPLLIAIDQENGGLNNLCDPTHIRQFPGAMGMAATGSTQLCREVAKATALEVSSVGINWVLGPVLDVLNVTSRNQPLGVRTMGHDPQEVSEMGVAFMQGLQGTSASHVSLLAAFRAGLIT